MFIVVVVCVFYSAVLDIFNLISVGLSWLRNKINNETSQRTNRKTFMRAGTVSRPELAGSK